MEIKTVTVIGANGTMGCNISGIFASFGNAKVYMACRSMDKAQKAVSRAAKSVRAEAIAENLVEMAGLQTPIVSVLIGEGGSGGALALALADRVWILENAVYSVISPEGCASILWKDSKKVKDAAECLRLTAQDMKELGVVEQVFSEEKDFALTYGAIREELEKTLPQLEQLPVEELLQQRYQRFRKF